MSASGAQGLQGALLRRRIEALRLEERLRAAEELQDELAAEGRVPDTRRLMLRRFAPLFRGVAGILLGLAVSLFVLVVNFVLFNMIVHIQF